MVEVIAKNTFISFRAGESADAPLHNSVPLRSRSAEAVRHRSVADAHEALAHPSTQRLNAVLSVGMSSIASQRHDEESDDSIGISQVGGIVHLSDLKELQQKLGRALSMNPVISEEHLRTSDCKLNQLRNVSNCSLSTMAPDDASECGNLSNRGGLSRMRNVLSSGSVSTMVSDWADVMSESGEDVQESGEDVEYYSTDEDEPGQYQITRATSVRAEIPATELEIAPTIDSPPEFPATTFVEKSGVNPEFSHGSVPRHRNWATLSTNAEKNEPPTTLMIRNVPSRLSQQDLVMELKDLGFAGTFDFLYIPMDKNTSANVGYAFVNFVAPEWASKCMEIFQSHCFRRSNRGPNKMARVSVAHMQGLEKNLQHYENTAVNVMKQTHRRPLVMTSIAKIIA